MIDTHTTHTPTEMIPTCSGFKIRTTRADPHLRLPLQGLIPLLHASGAPALLLSCSTPQMHTTQRGWPLTALLCNVAGVLLVRWWEPISLIAFRKNRLPLPLLSHLQGKIVLSEGKSTTLCQCLFYFVSTDLSLLANITCSSSWLLPTGEVLDSHGNDAITVL